MLQAFANFYKACETGNKKEIKAAGNEFLFLFPSDPLKVDVDLAAALAPKFLAAAKMKIKFALTKDYYVHRGIAQNLLNIILGWMTSDEASLLSDDNSRKLCELACDLRPGKEILKVTSDM